jgi:hypothetical protein
MIFSINEKRTQHISFHLLLFIKIGRNEDESLLSLLQVLLLWLYCRVLLQQKREPVW